MSDDAARAEVAAADFVVVEAFPFTGRGVVVVLETPVDRAQGVDHAVEVRTAAGETFTALARKEWLLRRQPTPHEREVFLLLGVEPWQVTVGGRVRFVR